MKLSVLRECAQQYWPDSAFRSEESLRQHIMSIVNDIYQQIAIDDYEGLDEWIELYRWAEARCHVEPLATAYEYGLMLITASLADDMSCKGMWADMMPLIGSNYELLATGDERRARLGMKPRPCGELRCRMLGNLARAKWLSNDAPADAVMLPLQVRDEYWRSAKRTLENLNQHPRESSRDKSVRELLQITGLDVACMMFKHFHVEQATAPIGMVSWFNRRFGNHLTNEVCHFRHHRPATKSWYYYQYELIKAWVAGELKSKDIDYLHEKKIECMNSTISDRRPVKGLFDAWNMQRAVIQDSLGRRFEIVGGVKYG